MPNPNDIRGEVCDRKTSLTPPLFIEVPLPSLKNERSCICVLEVSILPLFTIFLLDFRAVPTVWYFLLDFRAVLTVWYFLFHFIASL